MATRVGVPLRSLHELDNQGTAFSFLFLFFFFGGRSPLVVEKLVRGEQPLLRTSGDARITYLVEFMVKGAQEAVTY